MNITPIKQKFLKLARLAFRQPTANLRDLSTECWEICPAEWEQTPAAIYPKSHLDRVTGLAVGTDWEQEMQRINGGNTEHAATIAYRIPDCQLLDGNLYKGAVRQPLTKHAERLITDNIEASLPEAVLAATYYGSFYFGHWLSDDMPLYLAAEALGTPVQPARKPYGHEPGYREVFNIHGLHDISRAHFDNLIILDDFGQNSYKRQRYLELRSRIRASVTPKNPGGKVMIRRGQQGAARALTNADAIEQVLLAQGFTIVDPEQSTVEEIVSALLDARIVVGLEGSHMKHHLYSIARNGALCLLQPPFRFNNVLKTPADCLGIHVGFVVGEQTEGGFSVNPNELLDLLEKVDKTIA